MPRGEASREASSREDDGCRRGGGHIRVPSGRRIHTTKRILGVFAALALGLAIAACGGTGDCDDGACGTGGGDGTGGTGGGDGTGGTGGSGDECPSLEPDGTLSGACALAWGCYESRGALAVEGTAQSQSTCENAGGTWSDVPCPAATGGACVQAVTDGWTNVHSWTAFTADEVRDICDEMYCGVYVEP